MIMDNRQTEIDDKKAGILFSGGIDSTYAAWTQIPLFEKIQLITFIKKGLKNPQNVQVGVDQLCKAFPGKEITHILIDFNDIYQRVTPNAEKWKIQKGVLEQELTPLWEDAHGKINGYESYAAKRNTFFFANECLQCKIAMHIAAIKYCRENNIRNLCDGSNAEQLDDGSQLEDVKKIAIEIFRGYGVNYYSPVFHVPGEERAKALLEKGIIDSLDHKILEKTHKIPSRQIQCTVPASVLWTICIFPWVVYDAKSCEDYVEMSCNYYKGAMEEGLKIVL